MNSQKTLEATILTQTHISDWVHTTEVEKRRLTKHMQNCEKNGIALISEMEKGQLGIYDHYSVATLGMDGERSFNRLHVVVDSKKNQSSIRFVSHKDFTNQSFYETLVRIYRKVRESNLPNQRVAASLPCEANTQRNEVLKSYMDWLIDNRTFEFQDQKKEETSIAEQVDITMQNCLLCAAPQLNVSYENVPFFTYSHADVKKIVIKKSSCSHCKITFHNLDSRIGFLEVNGNAFSIKLLHYLHISTIQNGQFKSSLNNLKIEKEIHCSENDVLIAMRCWQDLTDHESKVCRECGERPSILFVDASGKRKDYPC
jgi:hypothetical protein